MDQVDVSQPSVTSQILSYRSAVRVDGPSGGGGGGPGGCGGGGSSSRRSPRSVSPHLPAGASASCLAAQQGGSPSAATSVNGGGEAAATGRQSQELLREMRRLRLQMSELERVAGNRSGSSKRGSASPMQQGASSSVNGAVVAGRGDDFAQGACGSGAGFGTASAGGDPGDAMRVHAWEPPVRPSATQHAGEAANGSSAWPWPRITTSSTTHEPTSIQAGRLRAEEQAVPEFAGWEYRPHASGDPVDAAVATLVNRPNGRYRSWRALLCRLEKGVYLCGTRRVHIRADSGSDRIEASDDGGHTWADLEDLMRGVEASQHALLERARGGAVGGSAGGATFSAAA